MKYRGLLSAICIASILACFARVDAAPIRFDQVITIVNPEPGIGSSVSFSRIRTIDDPMFIGGDGEDDKTKKAPLPQDGRVITETKTEIVTDDVCDCEEEIVTKRGFPKWALLGLAAIPIAFILIKRKKETPTPTQTIPIGTPTPTPPGTPTPTPPGTPTPTPKMTPTPTPPPITPTPTPPEPVPEPMTILLFGTGLASIGMAARRKFGKKADKGDEKEEE
jgi:PEP-CTERM motif